MLIETPPHKRACAWSLKPFFLEITKRPKGRFSISVTTQSERSMEWNYLKPSDSLPGKQENGL